MKMTSAKIRCIHCKKEYTVSFTEEGYKNWAAGMVIQKAMPEVPVADRELLISHTCGECFDEIFREDN